MVLTRKIKLYPLGDKEEVNRVYKFIRDGQYAQYQALNLAMGLLTSTYFKVKRDIKRQEFKDMQKQLTNSNEIFEDIEFATGVDSLSSVIQKVKQDFSTALKNGLAKGERCVSNYKRTFPLMTRGRSLTFYPEDDTKDIFDAEYKLYLKWVNKSVFKVILGDMKRSRTLRSELENVLKGEYEVAGSSIMIDGKNIILNLSMKLPDKKTIDLDENKVVGVDLGIKIPAVCGLNCDKNNRKFIGSIDDFLKVRVKIQSQLRQERKKLKHVKGGKGRNKKLKSLDRFKNKESNFVQTYNHFISKNIIDFALKHNAKYINIEGLNSEGLSDRVLRNWSYYQLQQYLEYKAKKYGIEVRKVNPYHTSQNCSICGHWEEGQRVKQDTFICKGCGIELNADFNASRNIALSTDFV